MRGVFIVVVWLAVDTMDAFTLRNDGCMQMSVSTRNQEIISRGFRTAQLVMNEFNNDWFLDGFHHLLLSDTDDSQHATGYHPAGMASLSRYNLYREGFVFSDGELFNISRNGIADKQFKSCMLQMRRVLHGLAMEAFDLLENDMQSSFEDNEYLHKMPLIEKPGKISGCAIREDNANIMEAHSQWHLKRYKYYSNGKVDGGNSIDDSRKDQLMLGTHTDPSLLSIVVHDSPGLNLGCMGLEIKRRNGWCELPHHGHSVCTVLLGGAMAHISPEGSFQACKHRVNAQNSAFHNGVFDSTTDSRCAVTYFLRPHPQTVLRSFPSSRGVSFMSYPKPTRTITFDKWCKRVSKNYKRSRRNAPLVDSSKQV